MEEFTNAERSLFLRFVWGRTRLPRTIADFRGRDFVLQVSKFCVLHEIILLSILKLNLKQSHNMFLCSPKNFGGAYSRCLVRPSVRPSVSPSVRPSVRPIRVRPITLLFEVGFRNHFTEMTTMLRRRVARNIWVPILKVKVTARPCSKIVSGP